MPEDQIILVEDTDADTKPVPVFKIAAATTAAFLVTRNLRRRSLIRREKKRVEKMERMVDNIMNPRHQTPVSFADVTVEDIINGTCTEI